MTKDEILNALDVAGLGHRRDEAAALLQPALRLTTVPSRDADLPVGASKMGGEPDLPPFTPWPHWKGANGHLDTPRPLHFLAQINFADAHAYLPGNPLPTSGLLSVFYDADEQPWGMPGDEGGFRILYTPAGEPLERCETHGALWALADLNAIFAPCALQWDMALPLHPLRELRLTHDESAALEKVQKRIQPASGYGAHQMLGLAQYIQNPITFEYAMEALGLGYGDVQGEGDDSPLMQRIRDEQHPWVLLLQTDSDDGPGKPGWMWGDTGMLYFHIHERDLAARDFDKARMQLQCC